MTERYQLREVIGRGGMAEVYRAYDEIAEMDVAIKVLHAHLVDDEAIVEAFEREAQMMQDLDHRAIVRVHSLFEVDGRPAIVMDLYEGGDLHRRLMLRGKLSQEEALALAEPILDALAYLHERGIIHRDIKPHNILLDDEDRPVLIDFGIGQNEEVAEMGADAQLGTVEYMAPERVDGLAIDGRSDIYSLGIMLFELVCGHLPYRADSAAAVMRMHRDEDAPDPSFFEAGLSKSFSQAIGRALSRYPEDRFQRATDMKEALRGGKKARPSVETHARWERLVEEFGGESSMVATSSAEPDSAGQEWVVFLKQDSRVIGGVADYQKRALGELVAAYPEHDTGKWKKDGDRRVAAEAVRQQGLDTVPNSAIARGLSRRGAEEIARRLEEAHLPIRLAEREKIFEKLTVPGVAKYRVQILATFLLLLVFFSVALGPQIYLGMSGLLILPLLFLTGVGLGFLATGRRGQEWYLAHFKTGYLLDFRLRSNTESTPLVDVEDVELVDQIRSPRVKASLGKIMSSALHLRDGLHRRDIDAEASLRRILGDVRELARAMATVETEIARVRPGLLVRRMEELDRRIGAVTDLDATEELMEKKAELRRQLVERDLAQQKLQALAQRLLDVARGLEELVQRTWDDKVAVDEEMLTTLDFGEAPSPILEKAVEVEYVGV